MSLLKPKPKNTVLTPIQVEYNKLYGNTEVVHTAAINRLIEVKKEIHNLEQELYKLEDIIDKTRSSITSLEKRQ
jgi:predicted  nucleic acid-binding Zn-ribbon protein